jgi:hypothetical protein
VSEPDAVLLEITALLERLGIPYAVGGSVAAGMHSIARSTLDIDILAALTQESARRLAAAARGTFYVPEQSMAEAVAAHSCFNLFHERFHMKVDLFVAGRSPLDHEELRRAVRLAPFEDAPRTVSFAAPEVMVVRKLDWYRQGGSRSDRQWNDVLALLRVQSGRLDAAWMTAMARELAVSDLLERALAEARPSP